jgi:hypothetical protein
MKKLLVTLAALLVSVSALAQGTITFHNRALTDPVSGAAYDAPISGDTVGANAQLFLVGAGGALTPLTPVQTFRPAPNNRFFVAPVVVTVPGSPAGTTGVQVRVRAWQGASYDTATVKGESGIITVGALGGIPASGPPITPPDLGGAAAGQGLPATGFAVIPEPSTMALGLLGAAALLFRRRK